MCVFFRFWSIIFGGLFGNPKVFLNNGSYIMKNNKTLIPGVVAEEGTKLNILNTEILGNLHHETIGR